jgi:DNA polymerase-3 subunit delta
VDALFLFTGENTYALRAELQRWIQEFERKYGPENLVRLEGKTAKVRSLLDEITVMPFLAERRLVIMEGLPRFTKEQLQTVVEQIHPSTILAVVDPKLDKRTAAAKELLSLAQVKEFPPLTEVSMRKWIESFLRSQSTTIEKDATELLLEWVGEDQGLMAGELEKLSLYARNRNITRSDVEELSLPTAEGVIWKLTDLLASGKKKEALAYAHRLLERGGDAFGMWAILLSMLRTLVAVSVAAKEGKRDPRSIASEVGVHFLAVRSMLPLASRMHMDALRTFLDQVTESDIRLKTGVYRATEEDSEELKALLDRFIARCPV